MPEISEKDLKWLIGLARDGIENRVWAIIGAISPKTEARYLQRLARIEREARKEGE